MKSSVILLLVAIVAIVSSFEIDAMGTQNCAAYSGTCYDIKNTDCSVGFRTGLCPGPSNIRCCLGRASVKAVAAAPTVSTSSRPSATFPDFNHLKACYPQGNADDVKERIGGRVDAGWITNTCAIRMSNTFNCASRAMNDPKFQVPRLPNNLSITSKLGENHIYRVTEFTKYMTSRYGAPTTTLRAPSGKGVDPAPLHNKRGLIAFTINWDDATGHLSLWDRTKVVEVTMTAADTARYFSLASEVHFWEM